MRSAGPVLVRTVVAPSREIAASPSSSGYAAIRVVPSSAEHGRAGPLPEHRRGAEAAGLVGVAVGGRAREDDQRAGRARRDVGVVRAGQPNAPRLLALRPSERTSRNGFARAPVATTA